MIAQAEGFFRQEGVDVEFVSALRPEEALVALVSGDSDVNPGPLHAGFLSAIAQGAKIRIAAGQGHLTQGGCTYYGIVLRPGLDPSRASTIARMRTSQDGATRFVASRMLAKHNVNLNAIETVRLPDAVIAMSLEQGSLDAVAVSEPSLTRLAKIGTLWLSGQDELPDFQWAVIAFGARLLYREQDTGVRFIRAYNRGVAQYREGKTPRNVAIIAEGTGESEDVTREACWPGFRADSDINWESIAEFQQWANDEGLMEYTLSRDQAFDSTFVSAARLSTTRP
jgi:NitT/TauT family transport system substrate-binding protein